MKVQKFYFELPDDPKNTASVIQIEKEDDSKEICYPCHLFLDQSTKTGYVVVDDKRRLVTAGHVVKEPKDSLADYKFGLRDLIKELIEKYKIAVVWYEEAYDKANHSTTEVLYYIKHMIKDLAHEYEEEIKILGIDHMKWKSLLAKPGRFKRSQDDKKQVAKLVKDVYPLLDLPEDTIDALGMSIAIVWKQTEKSLYYNARINKKLPVFVEVTTMKKGDTIEEIVSRLGKHFRKKMEEKGIFYFEYNTDYDEVLNCRYILSFRDGVCWSKIPYHRNMGMILLHYGIIPKKLEEDEEVILIACRKK